MGSDVSQFNVSLIVRDKVTRQCPQTTTFEEKGEPKRIRTEVPLLTSLTPYRKARPAQKNIIMLPKCCFTPTETVGLLGTEAQDVHLDFHAAPELWKIYGGDVELHVLGCRLTYIREKLTNAEARFSVALRPQKPQG